MKIITIATAMTALLATPAFADDSFTPQRLPASIRVSTDGINPANPRDMALLQKRIDRAIWIACRKDHLSLDQSPDRQCHAEMATQVTPIVARLQNQTPTRISQN